MRFITVSLLALPTIMASAEMMSSLPTNMCSDTAALGNWMSSYTQMVESHYKSVYENNCGSHSAAMATAAPYNGANSGVGANGTHQDDHADHNSDYMHSGETGTSMGHTMTSASSVPYSTASTVFEGKGASRTPVLLGAILAGIPIMML
ncbi:hypothetical protein OXX69_005428 [Metschnikowia pulcherrima]